MIPSGQRGLNALGVVPEDHLPVALAIDGPAALTNVLHAEAVGVPENEEIALE